MNPLFNPIVWSVLILMGLSLTRMNVVLALLCAALVAGLGSGLELQSTLSAFTDGLGDGANIALSYALLEDRRLDPDSGRLLSRNLEDYRIAGLGDAPEIDIHFDRFGKKSIDQDRRIRQI